MKTTVFFRVIMVVTILLAGTFSTEAKAQNDNFVTSDVKIGELVTSKIIYRLDGTLFRHMKYDFTYDDQKRMTSKEAFKWNAVSEKWLPYFKIDFTYTDNEITLIYAQWNESHKAYDRSVKKSVYELNEANMPVACTQSVDQL